MVSGCSENENVDLESLRPTDILKTPEITKTTKENVIYAYASEDEIFTIEDYGLKVSMSFDDRINMFKGTVENVTEETITDVRVEVKLDSGWHVGIAARSELKPLESNNISIAGAATPANGWRVVVSTGENKEDEVSSPIITISANVLTAYLDIPEGGIQYDGYTYAGREQTYILEAYGLRLVYQYDPNYNAFRGTISNVTTERISNIHVDMRVIGTFYPEDCWCDEYIDPGKKAHVSWKGPTAAFDAWRPSVYLGEHGDNDNSDYKPSCSVTSNPP